MLYEFTITLHPRLYRLWAPVQLAHTKPALIHAMRGFNWSGVAELTTTHNVHYHLTVDLVDVYTKDRLLNRFRKLTDFGKKSISQLVDFPKWKAYCNKSLDETRLLIGDPIVWDDLLMFANLLEASVSGSALDQ